MSRFLHFWPLAVVIAALAGIISSTLLLWNPGPEEANVWLTTGDQVHLLDEEPAIEFKEDQETAPMTVEVDEDDRYQTMLGFGAATTGSSAYLINQTLTPAKREALLDDLFTDEGIGLNMFRQSIGASDFSVDSEGNPLSYSYDDVEVGTDFDLSEFSIENDADVIRLLQDIFEKNEDAKVLGSPWSAPPWMKVERTYNGSFLEYRNSRIYETYANYFVKYIQAYAEEGIPIYGIMVQNEPEYTSPFYPTMSMNATEQAMFIGDYLGPAFEENNVDTQIIAFDHNWDTGVAYATEVYEDPEAAEYVDGTAFHCYQGRPDAMTELHAEFPEKHIYFTECSAGAWSTDFGRNLSWIMEYLMVGSPRNWAETVMLWNLALTPEYGPKNGGCPDCTGVVEIDPESGEVTKNMEYYALGHSSKFVEPGAVRIGSTHFASRVETVAYENPDGTIVLLAANTSTRRQDFQVRTGDRSFDYSLPAQSAVTFTWET